MKRQSVASMIRMGVFLAEEQVQFAAGRAQAWGRDLLRCVALYAVAWPFLFALLFVDGPVWIAWLVLANAYAAIAAASYGRRRYWLDQRDTCIVLRDQLASRADEIEAAERADEAMLGDVRFYSRDALVSAQPRVH